MGKNKTRDGAKISYIVRIAREIGATLRDGTNHATILKYPGLRTCPVASSTDARRMVAPWLAQARGCSNTEAYTAIRAGSW